MPALYTEADANATALQGRQLAVIGYDVTGRAIAQNLRDSGLSLMVGELNEVRAANAREDGFEPQDPADVAQRADTLLLTLPDEILAEGYFAHVAPGLNVGDMLVFLSGYAVAFGFIEPPPFVDAVMIAPRTVELREAYQRGTGFLSFLAVEQDSSGQAWPRLLAMAQALGALRSGALELTFQQEAELTLFVQQAILPALHHLMLTAADILIHEGYPPEAALLDLYISGELGNALQKASALGLVDTLKMYSLTGQYGILSRADRFQDTKLRRQMETALDEVRSAKFAHEWAAEFANGHPRLEALRRKRSAHALSDLEKQAIALLRRMNSPNNPDKPT